MELSSDSDSIVDCKEYSFDWSELEKLYEHYRSQWQAILPDQEKRFALFREQKLLIGK